jgi:hypothetical protein
MEDSERQSNNHGRLDQVMPMEKEVLDKRKIYFESKT